MHQKRVLLYSCALCALSKNDDTQAPILDFGVIKLGSSKSLECSVRNLDQQEQQVQSSGACMCHMQYANRDSYHYC